MFLLLHCCFVFRFSFLLCVFSFLLDFFRVFTLCKKSLESICVLFIASYLYIDFLLSPLFSSHHYNGCAAFENALYALQLLTSICV